MFDEGEDDEDGGGTTTRTPLLRAEAGDAGEGEEEDEEEWECSRIECLGELEAQFTAASEPFQTFDVHAPDGDAVQVATLKGLLRVIRRETDAAAGLPARLPLLLSPSRYVVRLYVLQGANLTPADRSGTSDPYLLVSLGDATQGSRSQRLEKVTDADFFQTFEFQTWLPGASRLRIAVMDYDTIGRDDLIGATTVDLEDRVFNPEWQALPLKPTEWRHIYCETSKNSQGSLRLWVDIESHEGGAHSPPVKIAPAPPQQWELRVVVWRTSHVTAQDALTKMNDMYAVVRVGRQEAQETDTHWRCADGNASFNWRCRFPVQLSRGGALNERLSVQLWDRDILESNDCIGEAIIPLRRWFRSAFHARARHEKREQLEQLEATAVGGAAEEPPAPHRPRPPPQNFQLAGDASVHPPADMGLGTILQTLLSETDSAARAASSGELKRFWVPVHRSESAEAQGWLQLSVELVSASVAESRPVGFGRSEPNDMPYLAPPAGRMTLSFNPLTNCKQILGPELCTKLGCWIAGAMCALLGAYLFVAMLPVLLANAVTGVLG